MGQTSNCWVCLRFWIRTPRLVSQGAQRTDRRALERANVLYSSHKSECYPQARTRRDVATQGILFFSSNDINGISNIDTTTWRLQLMKTKGAMCIHL